MLSKFEQVNLQETDLQESLRSTWENNIRMNLIEIGITRKNLVDSSQDRDYWRALLNTELSPGFHKLWN